MCNMFRLGSVLAAGLLCAAPVPARRYGEQPFDTSTCRDILGQAEIDGVMQPFTGHACQQSDGSWVLANDEGNFWTAPTDYGYYGYPPGYWGATWFWGPSFVFFDGFHHRHFGRYPGHFVGMRSGFSSHPGHVWGSGQGFGGGMRRR